MFASDYPHFDWDDPSGFLSRLDGGLRDRLMRTNAIELYDSR